MSGINLNRQVDRLKSLLDSNAPSLIIASQTMLLFACVWSEIPTYMEKEFGRWMTRRVWRYTGKCIDCGSPHSVDEFCDSCNMRIEIEANECEDMLIEQKLDEEDAAGGTT